MAIRVRPKPRIIRSEQELKTEPDKRPSSVIIETSHARQILNLPNFQREIVIEAIKEGSQVGEIARYFSEQGYLRVSENTFKQYLTAFKRLYPELVSGGAEDSIDSIIDGKRPSLDEEVELERLIRMQKVRLKVGVDFEKNTRFINGSLHRDVTATAKLIELLADVRGKLKGTGRPGANAGAPISNEANEQLRAVDLGEAAQEKLVNSLGSLMSLVNAKTSQT